VIAVKEERWLPVVGFEGTYEVSDHGRVRSLDRVISFTARWKSGIVRTIQTKKPGMMLKPGIASHGYPTVALSRCEGGQRLYGSHCVHILVLTAFTGPCPPGLEACHNDGNRKNPYLNNLRWDTREANAADAATHGTRSIGSRRPNAKLGEDDARKIFQLRGVVPQSELADQFGVSPSAIQAIHDGRSWKQCTMNVDADVKANARHQLRQREKEAVA